MWRMMQQETPDDYVIGTGECHSVREFLEEAFAYAGLDWQQYVKIDPQYLRPTETYHLVAEAEKAKRKLGWEPKVTFKELVKIMVDADMEAVGLKCPGSGKKILSGYDMNTIDRALTSSTLKDEQ
jgi:GDPmannose 4,6-dehydratase